MLSLPKELLYNICFRLPLNDIYHVILTSSYFNSNIKINWKDYFLHHTGIDEKILNNFSIIDKNSLFEYRVDFNFADDYGFMKWDDFFSKQRLLHQNNKIDKKFMIDHGKFLIDKSINIIKQYIMLWPRLIALDLPENSIRNHNIFSINFIDQKGYFTTYVGKKNHFHMEYYLYENDRNAISKKRCLLLSTYNELREIILNNDLLDVNMVMEYQIHPTIRHEIIRLLDNKNK